MSEYKLLRQSLGLNQDDFALIINVQRSFLSQLELQARNPPTSVVQKTNLLHEMIRLAPPADFGLSHDPGFAEMTREMKDEIALLKEEIKQKAKALEKMKSDYLAFSLLKYVLERELKTWSEPSPYKTELERMMENAKKSIRKTSPCEQARMQLRIRNLESMVRNGEEAVNAV